MTKFFNMYNNSPAHKRTSLTHFCKFASLINKTFHKTILNRFVRQSPLPHSCSFAVNGSPVGVCNDFVILPPSSRPQLTRAGEREKFRHCEGCNGLPTEAIQLINNIFGKISPNPLFKKNFSPLTSHFSREGKRVAFTLAEVLITLGIIGVVAAVTLSVLIENYQKNVTVTRLKYVYSVLSQAIQKSEAENGDIAEWDFDGQFFEKYLLPHIKKVTKHKLNGNGSLGITYRQISGKPEVGLVIINAGITTIYTLANGTQIFFYENTADIKTLVVDINGFAGPNQFGKDLFIFYINKEHKLQPMGRYNTKECTFESEPNTDREVLKSNSCLQYGCNKQGRGMWCGALIMTDGWKIAPDYPW